MDNKALADFTRGEISKVLKAIDKVLLKVSERIDAPREKNAESEGPRDTANHQDEDAPGQTPLKAQHHHILGHC
jgi:hypothetical protein